MKKSLALAVVSVASALVPVYLAAQPARPPAPDLISLLGLDATRAAAVQSILDDSHAAMEAVRAETDRRLGEVLTAEELARLKTVMPGPHARRTSM